MLDAQLFTQNKFPHNVLYNSDGSRISEMGGEGATSKVGSKTYYLAKFFLKTA